MATRKFLFINPTEGFSEEQAATDELSLGKVTAVGVSGVAFDASNNRIVNVADPTAATDAVNKQYLEGRLTGLDWKDSVRLGTNAALPAYTPAGSGVGKTLTANANGALSVDGVAVVNGDRILVKDQATSHADHGIYVVTAAGSAGAPFVLTRATDADQNAEVTANLAVFVEEGSFNQDTGWTLVTDNPIVVDTTTLQFTQFTGTGSITAGAGVSKTGNQIDVELDTTAGAQTTGSGGGTSGLEFDVSGAAGKLRAKVDPAGGIQRLSAGLALEIDDTPDTLDVGANGVKVVGLPSLFKINDVNVGANVTAANVDTLVNGTASSADALHRHNRVDGQFTADEAITASNGIAYSTATNNRVVKGRADTDAKSRIVAVSRTAAAGAGNTLEACAQGPAPGVLSGATVGTPYYLQATGGIGTALPGSGNRIIQVGMAMNATDLWVRIVDYGKKA